MKKTPDFWVFAFLTYTTDTFCKKNESKRPTLPSVGSETFYTRLYGVATANSDDPHRNPKMNTRIIKLGKTQLLLLGKFEYTGGPIFKVVLEC